MKDFKLDGTVRTEFGKVSVKKYRKEELVPAVIYDKGTVIHFCVPQKDIRDLIYTPECYLIHISIEGKTHTVILTSTQFHHVHEFLQHLEFLAVDPSKTIQVNLPVRLTGTSEGALAGGRLVQKSRKLTVRGLAGNLPDFIEVDVTTLKLGRSLKVRDLNFDGFMIASPGDLPVATVEITRQLRQEAGRK